jgi:hypothetical protein
MTIARRDLLKLGSFGGLAAVAAPLLAAAAGRDLAPASTVAGPAVAPRPPAVVRDTDDDPVPATDPLWWIAAAW